MSGPLSAFVFPAVQFRRLPMRGDEVGIPSVEGREQQKPLLRSRTGAGLFQCLVVSVQAWRREAMASAASDQGWTTVVCADAQNARAASQRSIFGLALVDLDRPAGATPSGFRELVEQLVTTPDLLVAVCGHRDSPQEESWARQRGVWLYLPGLDRGCKVSTICREAMIVARRLSMPTSSFPPAGQRRTGRAGRQQEH